MQTFGTLFTGFRIKYEEAVLLFEKKTVQALLF
jgi:hypothetical protein